MNVMTGRKTMAYTRPPPRHDGWGWRADTYPTDDSQDVQYIRGVVVAGESVAAFGVTSYNCWRKYSKYIELKPTHDYRGQYRTVGSGAYCFIIVDSWWFLRVSGTALSGYQVPGQNFFNIFSNMPVTR